MRYLGGKHKIGYLIARLLNNQLNNRAMPDGIVRMNYVEPFVGGANVIKLIRKDVERIGSDICEPLIDLYKFVAEGRAHELPNSISEEEWRKAKLLKDVQDNSGIPNYLLAFIGFGASFSGMWFKSYARDNHAHNYHAEARSSLIKSTKWMSKIFWQSGNYYDINYPKNSIIYCDPPYEGTSQVYDAIKFNRVEFYRWSLAMADRGHLIYISEYSVVKEYKHLFECCLEIDTSISLGGNGGRPNVSRIERIFTPAACLPFTNFTGFELSDRTGARLLVNGNGQIEQKKVEQLSLF